MFHATSGHDGFAPHAADEEPSTAPPPRGQWQNPQARPTATLRAVRLARG
jgi:hypothetical protein